MFGIKDNLSGRGKRARLLIAGIGLQSLVMCVFLVFLENVLGCGNRSRSLSAIIHIYRSALAPRYFYWR